MTQIGGIGLVARGDLNASVASELRKLGEQEKELPDGLEVEGTLGPQPSPHFGQRRHKEDPKGSTFKATRGYPMWR